MIWLFQMSRVDVIQNKQIQYRFKQIAGTRQVQLHLRGGGLVRIRYREDGKEHFQSLTTFWFQREDRVDVVFPLDAELNIQILNFGSFFENSFTPKNWTEGGSAKLPLILKKTTTYHSSSFDFKIKKTNPSEAWGSYLLQLARIGVCWRHAKYLPTNLKLLKVWPRKLGLWYRNPFGAKSDLGQFGVVLPSIRESERRTLTGEK
jgi:hypothetical protein